LLTRATRVGLDPPAQERIYEQKRAQNGAAQDDDDDADDLAAMEEEEDSEEEEEEADEEAEDVHSAAQEYAAEDDDEIEEIDLDDEGEEPDKADRAQAGRGSAVGQSAFRAAQKAEQERAQAQAQAQAQQQQQAQRQHQQQQQQQQQQRARAEQPAAARAESDSDELEIAAQLLDSATTRMYLVADADDDLHLSPRDLRDGIVATGQLLLASYGCRLPAGTAVTVKDLTAAIEQIMHVCDTVRAGSRQPRLRALALAQRSVRVRASSVRWSVSAARAQTQIAHARAHSTALPSVLFRSAARRCAGRRRPAFAARGARACLPRSPARVH
jgi:hypothetical protein